MDGIAGTVTNNAENCKNYGTVTGELAAGGVVGYYSSEISNCINEGRVTAKYAYAGGVAGHTGVGSKITNCYNKGNVTIETRTSNEMIYIKNKYPRKDGSGYSNQYAGGIVSVLPYNDDYKGTISLISRCANSGDVTAYSSSGGITGCVAHWGGKIEECYNSGTIKGTTSVAGITATLGRGADIFNCYNIGTIKGVDYVSGITAKTYDGEGNSTTPCDIQYCYTTKNISNTNNKINIKYIVTNNPNYSRILNCEYEEFKIKEEFWNNADKNIWEIKQGVNNGYPILKNLDYSKMER